MAKEFSIASVTVAFNGAGVLSRQMDALQRQTHNIDEIVVVNNASSDNTLSLLETHYPDATVLNQSENGGVGGGFSAGLDYAANARKHDWIWLLDQDSVPADDGLEQLIEGLRFLGDDVENTAILAPLCMHAESELDYSASLWRNGLRKLGADVGNQKISFVDSVISSGTLVRKEAVEEVGLPRADFFIDFVDHEYCLRVRRHGYKIAVIAGSKLDHAIGDTIQVNIFGFRKNWPWHAPWREYYMTRNEIFTVWKYFPDWRTKLNVTRRLLRHAAGVLLLGRQKRACLTMMYRGVVDGRAGHLGVRYFEG
jgi:GT2 family glycosyltransferase